MLKGATKGGGRILIIPYFSALDTKYFVIIIVNSFRQFLFSCTYYWTSVYVQNTKNWMNNNMIYSGIFD